MREILSLWACPMTVTLSSHRIDQSWLYPVSLSAKRGAAPLEEDLGALVAHRP